jgi:hypothetical protein
MVPRDEPCRNGEYSRSEPRWWWWKRCTVDVVEDGPIAPLRGIGGLGGRGVTSLNMQPGKVPSNGAFPLDGMDDLARRPHPRRVARGRGRRRACEALSETDAPHAEGTEEDWVMVVGDGRCRKGLTRRVPRCWYEGGQRERAGRRAPRPRGVPEGIVV